MIPLRSAAEDGVTTTVRHGFGRRWFVALSVIAWAMLAAMSPSALAQTEVPSATPPLNPAAGTPGQPCYNGKLTIADLESADDTIADGIEAMTKLATAWQSDARLYSLRLGCPLLSSGLQWNGTFFSETAQAFYTTDTAAVEAAEDDPDSIPTLDATQVSFRDVYRSLLRAGFGGDLTITASGGVTVQMSTDSHPFGPSSAPKGVIYVHVAIFDRNEVKDVWISAVDGTVYRYEL